MLRKRLISVALVIVLLSSMILMASPALAASWNASMPLPNRVLTSAEISLWENRYITNGGMSPTELEVFNLINSERRSAGLSQLNVSIDLFRASRFKSQLMKDLGTSEETLTSPIYGSITSIVDLFGTGTGYYIGGVYEGSG